MNDYPTMYDLPVSFAFGVFIASIQDLSTPNELYNGVTASQLTMSVLYKYEPRDEINEDSQEESSSQAKKLKTTITEARVNDDSDNFLTDDQYTDEEEPAKEVHSPQEKLEAQKKFINLIIYFHEYS
ncbi:10278_t:CDS:2 [Racocetra fulgida]|uniref:10278_t:CDS:1 n=1 Tax=Racocetra fulgida TaxID=60492 RepID=A0A9N9FHV6_9GLOM|nr:10278_t:CDS:2 [Racocetra fulgida]